MPKLKSGGVRITAMKDGNLKLDTVRADYVPGEEDTLVKDLIENYGYRGDQIKYTANLSHRHEGYV